MIGVFDSGFGGLTILKEFLHKLPQYDYIYLGDNARAPYGDKSQEAIYGYTKEAVDFLFKQGCELIIVACNTASSKALRKIQQEYLPAKYPDKRVLGVVIPLAEEAMAFNNIGVIGTRATIESKIYEAEIKKLNIKANVFGQACPLLFPLIEEGWFNKPEMKMILKKYLRPLKEKEINVLILGCTHYPILTKDIKGIMGKQIIVLDSPKIVAEKLAQYFNKHREIENKLNKSGKRLFFTTDNPEKFKIFGLKFLGQNIKDVHKTKLN